MKIYFKILLITIPLIFVSTLIATGTTFFVSRTAMTDLAENWLEARLDGALQIIDDKVEKLQQFGLTEIGPNVQEAQVDARKEIEEIGVGEEGYIYILDKQGIILLHPNEALIGSDVSLETWFEDIQTFPRGKLSYFWLEEPQLGIYQYFEPWEWYIVATDTKSEVYGRVNQSGIYILELIIAEAILASLVLMFFARRLVDPLQMLAAGAKRIGQGYFDTHIPVNSQDEIGTLATTFNDMAAQLSETLSGLEQRVEERTGDLALAAQISRRVSQIHDLDTLLAEAAELIRSRFNLYYTQIYLTDDTGQFLQLRGGTGPLGQALLKKGHQLPINSDSITGTAVITRKAVVISDTTASSIFMANPSLKSTRSELAVPLIAGEHVLGVLDLQSEQVDSLSEGNLFAFEALAGQLAIAIQNATLFTDLEQAQTLLGDRVRELRCLNDIGHKTESAPPIPLFLQWVTERVPPAMRYPEHTRVAITFGDQIYGSPDALHLSNHIVEGLRISSKLIGRVYIAYKGKQSFADEESAFIGGIGRRISSYIQSQQLLTQIQTRAAELQTVAEVSMVAATTLDTQELLQNVVDLTQSSFNLYHVHIYLLDEVENNLVLAAGAGTIGHQMVADKRYIPLNSEQSLVAQAARTRQGVVTNDVHQERSFLPHPLLPNTRSEMSIPMIVGEQLLGVLDVQSDKVNHFTSDDVHIQTTLATQIAIALQRAYQFEQTQATLNELRTLQHTITHENWQKFMTARERPIQGYVVNQAITQPIMRDGETDPDISDGITTPTTLSADETAITTPMQIRGNIIGKLGIRIPAAQSASPENVALLEAISQQIAEALERARLFEETEEAREQTEALYTSSERVFRATQIDGVLQALVNFTTLNKLDQVGIFIFDRPWEGEQPRAMTLAASHGPEDLSPTFLVGTRFDQESFPMLPHLQPDKPLIFNDVATDEQLDAETRTFLQQKMQIQGLAIFPLMATDQWIGILAATNKTPIFMSEDDVRRLTSLIDQAATVIQNLRLFGEAQAQAQREQILREVTARVHAAVDADSILRTAAEEIGRLLGLDAFVYLDNKIQADDRPVLEANGVKSKNP